MALLCAVFKKQKEKCLSLSLSCPHCPTSPLFTFSSLPELPAVENLSLCHKHSPAFLFILQHNTNSLPLSFFLSISLSLSSTLLWILDSLHNLVFVCDFVFVLCWSQSFICVHVFVHLLEHLMPCNCSFSLAPYCSISSF